MKSDNKNKPDDFNQKCDFIVSKKAKLEELTRALKKSIDENDIDGSAAFYAQIKAVQAQSHEQNDGDEISINFKE